ncbi:hypothetical protein ACFX2I_022218 [Malus domestica]|uniref:Uncharacterized protein n=1 Tax=Malus domestica TaxID=3750 RepID=A0A498HK95_MALDO|nr:hypothetical protein DVH24_013490 [Malus domestica]
MMKPSRSRRLSFSSSTSTIVTYTLHNDQLAPLATIEIPIQSSDAPIPITLHLPQSTATIKIQSTYRAYLIRTHFKTIVAVHSEADEF